jgi:hypothetical protein
MRSVIKCALPANALLQRYAGHGNYCDCYTTEIQAVVHYTDYVSAFYTTPLFKLERFILDKLVHKPSSDAEACRLARAEADTFAAWFVEAREENQILLADYRRKTRSWLMLLPLGDTQPAGTRLYFGSAVVASSVAGGATLSPLARTLMTFHKLYSRALLASARSKLRAQVAAGAPS